MSSALLFWVVVLLICYPYLIYPLLLMQFSRSYGRNNTATEISDYPAVAVVISAYNEQKHIVARIENLLQQDYPEQQLTIYIGSDGSQDKTVELVRKMVNPRVVLFDYDTNRGKISVLNDMLSHIKEPLVVFSDANTYYQADAINKLVRHFSDPDIAGVCGELHLVDAQTGNNQDGLYWRLEQFLKLHEGRLNAYLGANGAIYALRRELYQPLPEDTITDDFTIFMNLAVAGREIRYDVEAVATEEVAPDVSAEYGRRVRIGNGNYQAFFRLFGVFRLAQKWRLFSYVSHKVIRWFTPHLMVLLVCLNVLLLGQTLYQFIFALQLGLFGYAVMLMKGHEPLKLPSVLRFLVFFISMNLALGNGFIRYISGQNQGTWHRTER